MTKSISTEISESVLQFAPESEPLSFGITVYNDSDQFASFQVALVAPGADPNQRHWYRLSPAVSAKIPPGDQTCFQAHLLSVPPVPGGFTGTMNLTIKVYSTELRDEDRTDLRLIITGEGLLPPKVTLPKKTFKAQPQEQVEVLTQIYNPNRKSLEVVLTLERLKPDWFPEGIQKSVTLMPAEEKQVTFLCHLPTPTRVPHDVYPFDLKILQPPASSVPQQLLLEVLPKGFVEFQCSPPRQWIPEKARRWLNPFDDTADYSLTFRNQSNVRFVGEVSVVDEDEARQQRRQSQLPFIRRKPEVDKPDEAAAPLPQGATLAPEQAVAEPGEVATLNLSVRRRLPWFGWSRLKRLQVRANLVDAQLDLRNDTQTLELHILPIIPVWLQLLGGLGGVCLLGLLWLLVAQRGHTRPVHTVQFNGAGTEVVSGAGDQTMRRWQVGRDRLRPKGVIARGDKAVRVVRYRPVNNDWVAAGQENGSIQLQSLLSERERSLEYDRDDRVFDLAFNQDARALWSAHGGNLVLQWKLTPDLGAGGQRTPHQRIESDFPVSAIALIGDADDLLAVGGRFQRFILVDLAAERALEMPYPRYGDQTDYINSLATAEEQPDRIAVADDTGFVSLWDGVACLEALDQCEPIDEWQAHGGDAVRSVAFSPDGCYLVSAGDDGRVRLWFLTRAGERPPDRIEGTVLRRSNQPLNAVDIRQQDQQLLVVSGGDDRKVRLNRVRLKGNDQCRAN